RREYCKRLRLPALIQGQSVLHRLLVALTQARETPAGRVDEKRVGLHVRSLGETRLLEGLLRGHDRLAILTGEKLYPSQGLSGQKFVRLPRPRRHDLLHFIGPPKKKLSLHPARTIERAGVQAQLAG